MKKFICTIFFIIFYNNFSQANIQDVEKFVNTVAQNIIKIVTTKNSQSIKYQKLHELINKDFDVKWMARFSIAKNYRRLSDIQKQEYFKLYSTYLSNSYSPILMKYSDQSYKINKVTRSGEKGYDVDITIFRQDDASPIKLKYHVKKTSDNHYQAVDMVVEGVSTILNQRSEFSSIVQNKGTEGLLEDLREGKVKSKYSIE